MKQIEFDKEIFDKFKKCYTKAVEMKKETFIFRGEWLVSYAKYVIEYLEPKFYAKRKTKT